MRPKVSVAKWVLYLEFNSFDFIMIRIFFKKKKWQL